MTGGELGGHSGQLAADTDGLEGLWRIDPMKCIWINMIRV